jgi:hypothetical protein
MSEFKPERGEMIECLEPETGDWIEVKFLGFSPRGSFAVEKPDNYICVFPQARPLTPKQPEIKLYDVVELISGEICVVVEIRTSKEYMFDFETEYKVLSPELHLSTTVNIKDLKPRPDKVAVAPAIWHGNSNHYITNRHYTSSEDAKQDLDDSKFKWPSRLCDFHIVDREVKS